MSTTPVTDSIKTQPIQGNLAARNGEVVSNEIKPSDPDRYYNNNKFLAATYWQNPADDYTNPNGERIRFGNSLDQELLQSSIQRNVQTMIDARIAWQQNTSMDVAIQPGWTKKVVPPQLGGVIMVSPEGLGISLAEYNQKFNIPS